MAGVDGESWSESGGPSKGCRAQPQPFFHGTHQKESPGWKGVNYRERVTPGLKGCPAMRGPSEE